MTAKELEAMFDQIVHDLRGERVQITRLTCSAETGGVIMFNCPDCKTKQIAHSLFVEKGFVYEINDKCSDCWAKSMIAEPHDALAATPFYHSSDAHRKDEIIDSRPSSIAPVDLGAILDDVEQLLTETDDAKPIR